MAGIKPPQGLFRFDEVHVFPWSAKPAVVEKIVERVVEKRVEVPVEVIKTAEVVRVVEKDRGITLSKLKTTEEDLARTRAQLDDAKKRLRERQQAPVGVPIVTSAVVGNKQKAIWAAAGAAAAGIAAGAIAWAL